MDFLLILYPGYVHYGKNIVMSSCVIICIPFSIVFQSKLYEIGKFIRQTCQVMLNSEYQAFVCDHSGNVMITDVNAALNSFLSILTSQIYCIKLCQ